MTLVEFTDRVRGGNGIMKVVTEAKQGHPVTDEQIAAWYRTYLSEGGWR